MKVYVLLDSETCEIIKIYKSFKSLKATNPHLKWDENYPLVKPVIAVDNKHERYVEEYEVR